MGLNNIGVSDIITGFFGMIGGGVGLTIAQAIINRKKNKADITQQSIESVLGIEKVANKRYLEEVERNKLIESKLRDAQQLIWDAKLELEKKNQYIDMLARILRNNNLDFPEM
jgi:hypothetical protein